MEFIVFSDDWGRHPTTCEHLFRTLLEEHRVLWVNTIGTRTPNLSLRDAARSVEKLRSYGAPQPSTHPNLTVLSPTMLPFNQWDWCRRFNRGSVSKALGQALDQSPMTRPVVVTSLPTTGDFFLDFPRATKVYYCVDDFSGMPGVNPERILRMERELIDQCQLHVYTARSLAEKFNGGGSYLPHGVDFEHFQGAHKAALPRNPEGPVIGFFGHVSRWIDIPLLVRLVDAHPEWTFLFVGDHDVPVEGLQSRPNVLWAGPVPYETLPSYARWFDVGLIPYDVRDPRIQTVNPVKLREYNALGLPVVSIPLGEIEAMGGDTYTATGPEGFGAAIAQALSEDTPERRQARRDLAARSTWRHRAHAFLKLLRSLEA